MGNHAADGWDNAWWREHPAYEDLCAVFKGHTASPHHLAYLVLTGLKARGRDITQPQQPDHCPNPTFCPSCGVVWEEHETCSECGDCAPCENGCSDG